MSDGPLRFVPSSVEGVEGTVLGVAVHTDKLVVELENASPVVLRYAEVARPLEGRLKSALLWLAYPIFGRPGPWMVADRDWFHSPPDRFFAFYTLDGPPIVVRMPADDVTDYGLSMFLKVRQQIERGGYATADLG